MSVNLHALTIGIDSPFITSTAPNYRPPSWPPPPDWPVVIDKNGLVVSRWGDPRWDVAPWAGKTSSIYFGYGEGRGRAKADVLTAENARLFKMVATWFIWGPDACGAVKTVRGYLDVLKPIFKLCSDNGISAANLMRFPKIFERVPTILSSGKYESAIMLLHRLYDDREQLGFAIVDQTGLKRLAGAAPDHSRVQTPYIPPRIWLYQVGRLRECLADFLARREQIEACFQFCLEAYIKNYGSLEAALSMKRARDKTPFGASCQDYRTCTYQGPFLETATRFGITELLAKWCGRAQGSQIPVIVLSNYFTLVTYAGLAYIANFTLQRIEEVSSLRARCLLWEEDEQLGRVPIICGETTKTDPDSDARWVTSPSVVVAIEAMSAIARLRMICDSVNPLVHPTAADQKDPYLFSAPTEPWASSDARERPYHIRVRVMACGDILKKGGYQLFDPEKMKITRADMEVARRLTPNLPENKYAVGKVWPLGWHQYRRTGTVNMFADGSISDSTLQQQLKHSSRLMSLYYGRNHGHIRLNKDVETAVVMAMYQAQAEMIKRAASGDRFISPHTPERKEALVVNVLSAKDLDDLIKMARNGKVAFREHRLGGCMKSGVCEYGGIESVARCAGGDGGKPCTDVLYDRLKEPQVRADLHRVSEEIKMLSAGQPRYDALVEERQAMENYLHAISIP